MSPDDVPKYLKSHLVILREDIARAKEFISKLPSGRAENQATAWLKAQGVEEAARIQSNSDEQLLQLARAYSLRKAFYQAIFELVANGDLILVESPTKFAPRVQFMEGNCQWEAGPLEMGFAEPHSFERLSLPDDPPSDPDVFLQGVDCKSLHSGIREAIERSLDCFRRGLYMPATAMLAAGAEATWTEAGIAVAANLSDPKLEALFADQYASISKKVSELRKAFEQPNAKPLLKTAGQSIAKINDAEVWTTVLRDRRNALHWGKAKSFVADHSETAILLMAAPLHIGTLEAIRTHC